MDQKLAKNRVFLNLLKDLVINFYYICSTVKPVYNDHLGDEVSAVIMDRWSL